MIHKALSSKDVIQNHAPAHVMPEKWSTSWEFIRIPVGMAVPRGVIQPRNAQDPQRTVVCSDQGFLLLGEQTDRQTHTHIPLPPHGAAQGGKEAWTIPPGRVFHLAGCRRAPHGAELNKAADTERIRTGHVNGDATPSRRGQGEARQGGRLPSPACPPPASLPQGWSGTFPGECSPARRSSRRWVCSGPSIVSLSQELCLQSLVQRAASPSYTCSGLAFAAVLPGTREVRHGSAHYTTAWSSLAQYTIVWSGMAQLSWI